MKKKIIAFVLSAATVLSCSSALAAGYSDVSETAWYYDYVNRISELKAFSGYEDGTFRPENEITQEEFLKTVVCLVGGELTENNMAEEKSPWSDDWDTWAAPYLDKAFELGLVTKDDSLFMYVGVPCNRATMAMLVTRAVENMGEEAVKDTSIAASKIKDYGNITEKYKPYVLQAYSKGIISGYEDGSFKPDGYLTRAEASSVLVRLVDKDARVTDTGSSSGGTSGGTASKGEKTYDFYGRQVTWTEPLCTDVPEQYQVSLSDFEASQAEYEKYFDGDNESQGTLALKPSKALLLEDLVLQTIKYDSGTIKLTIPDILPENQEWNISLGEGFERGEDFSDPKDYIFENYDIDKVFIRIRILPTDDKSASVIVPAITIEGKDYMSDYHKFTSTMVGFGRIEDMPWVQGQSIIEYLKDYTGELPYELDW